MSEVTMTAMQLMIEADKLTGVHPGMDSEQIRATQASMSTDMMITRYCIEKYKETNDSTLRYELAERLRGAVARSPMCQILISKELPRLVIRPPKKGQRKPKPRSQGEVRFE